MSLVDDITDAQIKTFFTLNEEQRQVYMKRAGGVIDMHDLWHRLFKIAYQEIKDLRQRVTALENP